MLLNCPGQVNPVANRISYPKHHVRPNFTEDIFKAFKMRWKGVFSKVVPGLFKTRSSGASGKGKWLMSYSRHWRDQRIWNKNPLAKIWHRKSAARSACAHKTAFLLDDSDVGDFIMVTDFRCSWQNHYVVDFFRYVGDFVNVLNRSSTSWIGH